MIREDFSAAAHQFFALARLLMSYEPRHGAVGLALSSGRYVDYRVGWNVIADGPHERFTWIDPTGTQPGLTTYERPTNVPESEIYREPEHPPFDRTDAHAFLNRALAVLATELTDDAQRDRSLSYSPPDPAGLQARRA